MKRIDINRAKKVAHEYCKTHGLSIKRFLSVPGYCFNEDCYFLDFPKLAPEDMYDTIKGRGFPVLIVRSDYSVEETEHTKKYFSEE